MSSHSRIEILIKLARGTLSSGSRVAVFGMKGHLHDREFLKLPGWDRRFILYSTIPRAGVGPRVGFVFRTKAANEQDTILKGNGAVIYQRPVKVEVVKEVFGSCADLLVPPHSVASVGTRPNTFQIMEEKGSARGRRTKMKGAAPTKTEKMSEFFSLFHAHAEKYGGTVGKKFLARMLQKCNIKLDSRQLRKRGIIKGEKRIGHRVGKYKAGEKMTDNGQNLKPADKLELAKFLVAQRPKLLERKAEVEKKLARIEVAERALAQLNEL